MEIKYCKNCVNFSPIYSQTVIEPDENYSWGYCRVIHRLEIQNNKIKTVMDNIPEATIDKVVAVNQPIIVNRDKICPAFSNLSDIFNPEKYNTEVSNIDILAVLNYVKCTNCFHVFASTQDSLQPINRYTCPICFHQDNYLLKEHFKRKPVFLDNNLENY